MVKTEEDHEREAEMVQDSESASGSNELPGPSSHDAPDIDMESEDVATKAERDQRAATVEAEPTANASRQPGFSVPGQDIKPGTAAAGGKAEDLDELMVRVFAFGPEHMFSEID